MPCIRRSQDNRAGRPDLFFLKLTIRRVKPATLYRLIPCLLQMNLHLLTIWCVQKSISVSSGRGDMLSAPLLLLQKFWSRAQFKKRPAQPQLFHMPHLPPASLLKPFPPGLQMSFFLFPAETPYPMVSINTATGSLEKIPISILSYLTFSPENTLVRPTTGRVSLVPRFHIKAGLLFLLLHLPDKLPALIPLQPMS